MQGETGCNPENLKELPYFRANSQEELLPPVAEGPVGVEEEGESSRGDVAAFHQVDDGTVLHVSLQLIDMALEGIDVPGGDSSLDYEDGKP
jgi:hypothetical protein